MKKFALVAFAVSVLSLAFVFFVTLSREHPMLPDGFLLTASAAFVVCAAVWRVLECKRVPFGWLCAIRVLCALVALVWIAVLVFWCTAAFSGGNEEKGIEDALGGYYEIQSAEE